jgi:hypothetical protein
MKANTPVTTQTIERIFRLVTARRLTVWATGLLILSWGLYAYTMSPAGLIDRAGRFKGSDYIQYYVLGSLVLEGKTDLLYDPNGHIAEGRTRIDPRLNLYAAHVNYGPQVALAFAPLAWLPFGLSLTAFLALTTIAYAVAVWLIWKNSPCLHRHGRLVALLAAASPLFLTVVRYAQLSAFTLLIWAIAFTAFKHHRKFAAGLAIGCLAFKPQLGLVIGAVLLIAREWRVLGGALVTGLGQLGVAWLVAGSQGLESYASVLWTLVRDPALVQLHPSEVHSIRGFLQLLVSSPVVIAVGVMVGLITAAILAGRSWRSDAPSGVGWAQVIVLTILASPHLLSYDLVMLTCPLLLLGDWCMGHERHPRRSTVTLLLLPLYFAPFSSNLARLIPVQLSVLVMMMLVWRTQGLGGQSVHVNAELLLARRRWYEFGPRRRQGARPATEHAEHTTITARTPWVCEDH